MKDWKRLTTLVGGILTLSAFVAWAGINISPPWPPRDTLEVAGDNLCFRLSIQRRAMLDLEYLIERLKSKREIIPSTYLREYDRIKRAVRRAENDAIRLRIRCGG